MKCGIVASCGFDIPSGRTVALRSTQPLTEMYIGDISLEWGGGKVCRCLGLATLPRSFIMKSGSLDLLEPLGPIQAYTGIALLFLNP